VIVNALYPPRFHPREVKKLTAALERTDAPAARGALSAALSEHARGVAQRAQRDRLATGLGLDLVELPYLFADHIARPELELLADALENGRLTNRARP
jgi:hypothetical protein